MSDRHFQPEQPYRSTRLAFIGAAPGQLEIIDRATPSVSYGMIISTVSGWLVTLLPSDQTGEPFNGTYSTCDAAKENAENQIWGDWDTPTASISGPA